MRIRPMVIPPYSMICHYALPSNRSSWVSAWIFFRFLSECFHPRLYRFELYNAWKCFSNPLSQKTVCVRNVHFVDLNETFRSKKKARKAWGLPGFWRSGWDSNPRYPKVQLISSQSRYDHFDTTPCIYLHISPQKNLGKRRELMERTKGYLLFNDSWKAP